MPQHDDVQPLTHFYDTHELNEQLILQQLHNHGVSLETLSEDVLKNFDMDHYDGVEAVDILADKAGIQASSSVLDVCCGLGGPSRYLAHLDGFRVMGLDISEIRIQSALRFTKMVHLDHLVTFRLGNALEMPFADDTFDVVIGQEAWVHVPDKPRLFTECRRVLHVGGMMAFTDFLRGDTLLPEELARWQHHWGGYAMPETCESYGQVLAKTGFTPLEHEDLGAQWAAIVAQRVARLRALRDSMVTHHGEDVYRRREATRQFMSEMFAAGKICGGRFIARLDAKARG